MHTESNVWSTASSASVICDFASCNKSFETIVYRK